MAAAEPFSLDLDPRFMDNETNLKTLRPPPGGPRRRTFKGGSGSDLFEGLTANFDCKRVESPATLPYMAIGKLFVRVGGTDRTGTAFVIGGNAIVTAGHCVFADGIRQWAEDIIFVPRYANGSPVGQWRASSLFTLSGWQMQGGNARAFDIGGVLLESPVEPATQRIGWFANGSAQQNSFHAVGYPRHWVSPRYDFDGETMWRCAGAQLSSGAIQRMANNMTQGASGGPWLIQRQGKIYANGLNSFRLSDETDGLCSPYFGTGFVNLATALSRPS